MVRRFACRNRSFVSTTSSDRRVCQRRLRLHTFGDRNCTRSGGEPQRAATSCRAGRRAGVGRSRSTGSWRRAAASAAWFFMRQRAQELAEQSTAAPGTTPNATPAAEQPKNAKSPNPMGLDDFEDSRGRTRTRDPGIMSAVHQAAVIRRSCTPSMVHRATPRCASDHSAKDGGKEAHAE